MILWRSIFETIFEVVWVQVHEAGWLANMRGCVYRVYRISSNGRWYYVAAENHLALCRSFSGVVLVYAKSHSWQGNMCDSTDVVLASSKKS